MTGKGTKRIRRPSRKWPSTRRTAPVESVARPAATTMVAAMACVEATPDMAAVMAAAGPAIATTGISSEIETAPRIGLVTAPIAATTIVVNSAMPSAIGTESRITPKKRRLPRLSDMTTARKPQTSPAASVCRAWWMADGSMEEFALGDNEGPMPKRGRHSA